MSVNINSSLWRIKTTQGNIPLKVVARSGSFGDEQSNAQEVYIIRANQLANLTLELFPLPIIQGGTVFYPRRAQMPGVPSLTAKSIAWKALNEGLPTDPFASDPGAPISTYDPNLEVTVTYSTSPSNDTESDPADPRTWLEITASGAGEYLAADVSGKATWDGGDEVKERKIPHTIRTPKVEWSCRWSQIPFEFFNDVLIGRLRDRIGTVNTAVMPLFNDAPAETMLFAAWNFKQQYTWRAGLTGQAPIQLELRFMEKNFKHGSGATQVTHQHFYRPGIGFEKLKFDGTQDAFAATDLEQIFTG